MKKNDVGGKSTKWCKFSQNCQNGASFKKRTKLVNNASLT